MSEVETARREADAILRRIDKLDPRTKLYVHREVCRRAAPLYAAMYRPVQEANYRAAMAQRDTRFQPGLSVRENITRCSRTPRLLSEAPSHTSHDPRALAQAAPSGVGQAQPLAGIVTSRDGAGIVGSTTERQ